MLEHSLHSVLICDIQTVKFPLDCSRAAVCLYMLFRVHSRPHSEGCAPRYLHYSFKHLTLLSTSITNLHPHNTLLYLHYSSTHSSHFSLTSLFLDTLVTLLYTSITHLQTPLYLHYSSTQFSLYLLYTYTHSPLLSTMPSLPTLTSILMVPRLIFVQVTQNIFGK